MKSPRRPRPRSAPSVLWRCGPWTAEVESQEVNLTLWLRYCDMSRTREESFSASHQFLDVVIALRDTLDVSWILPGGETYSVQGAPAQDQTCS